MTTTVHFDVSVLDKDFTPTGVKREGLYENDRNMVYGKLHKDIVCEAYNVTDVICGHHIVYQTQETRADGFVYQIVQEVPSADALIFDTDVAKKIWGEEEFESVLMRLAVEPVASRDLLLADLYYGRAEKTVRKH